MARLESANSSMRSGLSTCGRHRHNLVVASVVLSLSSSCVICVSVHHPRLRQCCWLLMGHGCMRPAPAPLPTADVTKARAIESTLGGGIGGVNGVRRC